MTCQLGLTSREACVARDLADPLRNFRERFVIPEGIVYLDGNSLGPTPASRDGESSAAPSNRNGARI